MSRQSLDATCAALLTLAAWTVAGTTLGQDQLAIRGGRIIPIVGKPIDNGVILVRDGKIAAVGKDLAIPIEASVIDATGKVILPGFVEAHSTSAMGQPNERNPNTPFVSVVDSIDPSRDYFEECRRNGVTTIAVVPGNDTMIGGQAAIIKTAGKYVEQMILKRTAGVKISLRPPSSASRMSHYAKLRKELEKASRQPQGGEKAKERRAEPKKKASDPDGKEEQNDDEQEKKEKPSDAESTEESGDEQAALKKVLHGKASAFIYCDNGMDVLQAIKLVKQYKLKAILVLGRDGYQAAEQIAENKLPVVLDHTLVFWRTDDRTGADEKIIVPQVFRQAGVPVTFQVSASSRGALGSGYLWHQAATAVKYGAPVDDSLKAITLRPAEVLGVDDFVGSIEPDKDADLVILSGNPLKVDTWVVTTIVNGRIVYERDKDKKLRKLLQPNEK